MNPLSAELKSFSATVGDERLRALERITPLDLDQEVLQRAGHTRRHCRTLSPCLVAEVSECIPPFDIWLFAVLR
jgi:hypothetical protein